MLGFTPIAFEKVQNLRVKELEMSTLFRRLLSASVFFGMCASRHMIYGESNVS